MKWFPLVLILSSAPVWAGSYFGSSANSIDPFIVVHSPGYDGTGGTLTVGICVGPEAANVKPQMPDVLRTWNELTPTIGNCSGCILHEEADQSPPSSDIFQLFLALAHELGHCAMGLDHIDWFDPNDQLPTSFTTSKNTGVIVDGGDQVRGSKDDRVPLPGTRVLHWYRRADNDPFVIDQTVIDASTYSRGISSLPEGSTWQASGNRAVGEFLGFPESQSIMYSGLDSGVVFSGLIADDVNTVRFAHSGIDSQAGTADDYTVRLELHADCSTAAIEILWTDQVTENALGECDAFIEAIDSTSTSVHHAMIPSQGNDRILVKINSTVRWDVAFVDGFETGDVSRWD